MKIQERPTGKAGRSDDAQGSVRVGQPKHTTRGPGPVSFIFPIDDRYRLTADDLSWRIERRKGKAWRPIAYYVTLQAAANDLSGRLLRTAEVQSFARCLRRGRNRFTHAHAGAGPFFQGGGAP